MDPVKQVTTLQSFFGQIVQGVQDGVNWTEVEDIFSFIGSSSQKKTTSTCE